jgi:protein O-mannosyl-transferase
VCIGLVAAVAALYGVAVSGPFIFDDIPHIVDNPSLASAATALRGGLQETRPVFLLSLVANYAVGGLNPVGYHLVNLALHAGCAIWLLLLARASRQCPAGAAEAAALAFAVHPLATESVAYVNSRSGVLAGCFGLAAMVLYLRFVDGAPGPRRIAAYAAALVCMVLAMGCKESAIVFPVLLWAYLAVFRYSGELRAAGRAGLPLLPFLACIAIVPVLFVLGSNPHQGTVGFGTVAVMAHVLTQVRVLAYFHVLLIAPVQQNLDYDLPLSTGVDLAVVGSAALLLGVVGLAVRWRRRAPLASFSVLWFFVAAAPTNSIIPFKDFIAERHLYVPLMGFCLLLGWAAARAAQRRSYAWAALALYLVALSSLTLARNQVLADPHELWTQTVASSPNKARPHVNLGIVLVEKGQLDDGERHLRRATELDPNDARAQYNLAVLWHRRGQLGAALDALRAAVASSPRLRYRRELARVANNWGIQKFLAGDLKTAEGLFRQAMAAQPDYAKAHYNLAEILLLRGDRAEAVRLLHRALAVDPAYQRARDRLAELEGS